MNLKEKYKKNKLFEKKEILNIVEEILTGQIETIKKNKPLKEKKACYIGGIPGVGKNYFLNKKANSQKQIVIDIDFYKPLLIKKLREKQIFFSSSQIHALSAIIACELRNFALQNKYFFYYLSTLGNGDNAKIELSLADKAGYDFEVEIISGSPEYAFLNSCERYIRSVKNIKDLDNFFARRFIPFEIIKEREEGIFKNIPNVNTLVKRKNYPTIENKKMQQPGNFYIYYVLPKDNDDFIMYYNAVKDNYRPNIKFLKEIINEITNTNKEFLAARFNDIINDFIMADKKLQRFFKSKTPQLGFFIDNIKKTKEYFFEKHGIEEKKYFYIPPVYKKNTKRKTIF